MYRSFFVDDLHQTLQDITTTNRAGQQVCGPPPFKKNNSHCPKKGSANIPWAISRKEEGAHKKSKPTKRGYQSFST